MLFWWIITGQTLFILGFAPLLCLLLLGWWVFSPKNRASLPQKLGFYRPQVLKALAQVDRSRPVVWAHAVSVGEFNALRPLLTQLLAENRVSLVVSTTTATGQALARGALPAQVPVFYAPLDVWFLVAQTLGLVRPALLLIVETELWPALITTARRFGSQIVLFNGRLSDNSYQNYLKAKAFLLKPLLQSFNALWMQSEQDAERVLALGAPVNLVETLGNVKLQGPVLPSASQQLAFNETLTQQTGWRLAAKETDDDKALILTAASTHAGEEALIIEGYQQLRQQFPHLKLILAPRHPERAEEVAALLSEAGLGFVKRSQPQPLLPEVNVFLLDTIGELLFAFGLSKMALVGGSWVPTGGHNILEPIALGVPTVFGPYMSNFREVAHLVLQAEAGLQTKTAQADELQRLLADLLEFSPQQQALRENGLALIAKNQGVSQKTVAKLYAQLGLPALANPST